MRFLFTPVIGVVLVLIATAPSQALTFDWQFTIEGFGHIGETVAGTISGLVEGSNDGTGLTVVVTSTPTGQFEGGGWTFDQSYGGPAFAVTGGAVTSADALFTIGGFYGVRLYFGGYGGYYPQLIDGSTSPNWFTNSGQTTFTASAVPLPAALPLLASGLGGLGLLGWRRKRKAAGASA